MSLPAALGHRPCAPSGYFVCSRHKILKRACASLTPFPLSHTCHIRCDKVRTRACACPVGPRRRALRHRRSGMTQLSGANDPHSAAAQGAQASAEPRHAAGPIFTGPDPSVQTPEDAVRQSSVKSRVTPDTHTVDAANRTRDTSTSRGSRSPRQCTAACRGTTSDMTHNVNDGAGRNGGYGRQPTHQQRQQLIRKSTNRLPNAQFKRAAHNHPLLEVAIGGLSATTRAKTQDPVRFHRHTSVRFGGARHIGVETTGMVPHSMHPQACGRLNCGHHAAARKCDERS